MRFSRFLVPVALAGTAALALAQQPETAPPPEARGLEDLEGTVKALQDEPPPQEPPAEGRPEPDAVQPQPAGEADPEPGETETGPEPASPPPPPGESRPEPDAAEPDPTPAPEPEPPEPDPTPPSGEASAAPATPSPPAPPLTRSELAEIERRVERGRLLVAIARAGMIASRDMLSRVSDPDGAGIDGWIAEPEGNAMAVSFYADGEDGPHAVYRATVLGGRVVSRNVWLGAERPALNPLQARMAAARAATDSLPNRACSDQPFYVLVVPPAGIDAPVDVYQTSTPAARGRFPLGGHFRSTVAADGTVSGARGFTNACVDIELPAAAPGQPPRPVGVTHLLDPMPTEIHLLIAQLAGRPLLVATGEPHRVWLVADRIAEVRP